VKAPAENKNDDRTPFIPPFPSAPHEMLLGDLNVEAEREFIFK
jgi:hypothetical protein